MIKALVVDDHKLFTESFVLLLQNLVKIEHVQAANSASEALEILKTDSINVLFLDIHMPDVDGMALCKMVKERYPEIKIVIVSMLDDKVHILKMFKLGAVGYFLKNIGLKELVYGLEKIMAGENYYSNDIKNTLLDLNELPRKVSKFKPLIQLSKREIEVIKLICEGYRSDKISDILFISKRTVDTHRTNIYRKLKINNMSELMNYAIDCGLYSL